MTRRCYVDGMAAMLRSHKVSRFTPLEICPVGRVNAGATLKAPPASLWPNIIPTLKIAQEAREYFGEPMIVNSGYRDLEYNMAVGSTSRRHVDFFALDVRLDKTPTLNLFKWFDDHAMSDRLGLGLYPTFVHIDAMGHRARWGPGV